MALSLTAVVDRSILIGRIHGGRLDNVHNRLFGIALRGVAANCDAH
jgi:hypothetical protein